MRAAARETRQRFGHETREAAMRARRLVGEPAEEDVAVGGGAGVGIGEIDLELADAVLVVEGLDVPAEPVHRRGQLRHPGEIVEQAGEVVGRPGEMRPVAERRRRAVFPAPREDVELRLHPQVHAPAALGGAGAGAVEDVAAARLEGRPPAVQVAGEPGGVGPPGEDQAGSRVGMGGDLLLAHVLRDAFEGGAGEQFRAGHHALETADRRRLGLGDAVHVDIAGQQEADAARAQLAGQRRRVAGVGRARPEQGARPGGLGGPAGHRRLNIPAPGRRGSRAPRRPGSGACWRIRGRASGGRRPPCRRTSNAA